MIVVGLGAGRIVPVRVGVVAVEVVGHRVDDRPRHLRAAGAVEVRDRQAVVQPIEGGEVRADVVDRGDCAMDESALSGRLRWVCTVGNWGSVMKVVLRTNG